MHGLLALHGQGHLDETLPVVKDLVKKHESHPGIPACGLDVLPQQFYHPDIGTDYFASTLGLSHVKCTGHWATKGGGGRIQVVLQRLNRGDAWMNNDVSLSQMQQELQSQEEEDDNNGVMDWSGGNSDSENEVAVGWKYNPQ
jgi:hypothetical protein